MAKMGQVVPSFVGGTLQRNAHERARIDPRAALAEGAALLAMWNGMVPVPAAGGLLLQDGAETAIADGAMLLWLGEAEGRSVVAVDLGRDGPEPVLPAGALWQDLRQTMQAMTATEAELCATARALIHWHASHGFCAACGARSAVTLGGWQRQCPACQTPHFPRTDPVVIMLVTRGDRLLMGRSPGWPEGMYSTLAGFMEPGETVEAAVRREVLEETGVQVGAVRYVSSQPWPFPSSLMLGCHGQALSDEITLDPAELEDALWLTRQEMLEVLAGNHPRLRPPRQGAIAHALVLNWLADRGE